MKVKSWYVMITCYAIAFFALSITNATALSQYQETMLKSFANEKVSDFKRRGQQDLPELYKVYGKYDCSGDWKTRAGQLGLTVMYGVDRSVITKNLAVCGWENLLSGREEHALAIFEVVVILIKDFIEKDASVKLTACLYTSVATALSIKLSNKIESVQQEALFTNIGDLKNWCVVDKQLAQDAIKYERLLK